MLEYEPIGWRTDQDLVSTRSTKASKDSINGFIRTDAHKEVLWLQWFGGVMVRVPQITEQLLQLNLVARAGHQDGLIQIMYDTYGSGYLCRWAVFPSVRALTAALVISKPGP